VLIAAPAGAPAPGAQALADAVRDYEKAQYASAVSRLDAAKIPRLADFAAYYRGAARAANQEHAAAAKDFAAVRAFQPVSPLRGKAVVAEAQSLAAAGQAREAVRLLHERYAELPQPDADFALATAYESAGENARAVEFYQRVYYAYPSGEPAMKAASALLTLRNTMGESYPPPTAQQALDRSSRLIALREYSSAQTELSNLIAGLGGADRDAARVRQGALDFHRGNLAAACRHLKSLEVGENEADAERLYYLAECARRAGDDGEMLDHIKRLGRRHPHSKWRLNALVAAANRFLLSNQQDRYAELYKDAAEAFPETSEGAYAHWKVTWLSYLRRKGDADDRLRAQLERFPAYNASAAVYFLGRLAERTHKYDEANAYYHTIRNWSTAGPTSTMVCWRASACAIPAW
jgi:hypothetical protein